MVNHSAIAIVSRPAGSRYIFLELRDKSCPHGRTERCFHKAMLFFLRLHPRIQFFLPLWCLRFCSVVPFFSPCSSSDHYFTFEHSFRGCDFGSFGRVFHEFIFILQELISFYFLICVGHLRILQMPPARI